MYKHFHNYTEFLIDTGFTYVSYQFSYRLDTLKVINKCAFYMYDFPSLFS